MDRIQVAVRASFPTRDSIRLPFPFTGWIHVAAQPILAWGWWRIAVAELERSGGLESAWGGGSPGGFALLATAGRALGYVWEAVFYCLFWKALGRRLPFWRFFLWLTTLSSADILAAAFRDLAANVHGWPRGVLAVAGGISVLQPAHATSGLWVGFGALGLLMIARLLGTAVVQARALGTGIGRPLVLTAMIWLVTRMVSWWLFDLARGMSSVG